MKATLKSLSYIGLLGTFVPSILVFSGAILLETHKVIMIIGMVLWFVTAPFWMDRKRS